MIGTVGKAFLALLLFVAFDAWTADVFVSPSGSDANPGTIEKPFATLERARDALRSISRDHPRGVIVRGGVYRVSKSLALGQEDSGTDGAPVTWEAAPGETVRLVGGVALAGWQPVEDAAVRARLSPEAREHVVQCDLNAAGITNLGTVQPQTGIRAELFFNHRYMPLARYPNDGWLNIADVPSDEQFKVKDKDDGYIRHFGPFQYNGDRPGRWRDAADVWIHGYWTYDWADEYQQVDRIDFEKSLIWPRQPYHHYGYTKGHRYYFLNVLEELDQPGEWYLDRANRILYFWPPGELESAEITFPDLEQPMVVLDNAAHIALRGMVFECSRAEAVVIKGGTCNEVRGCTVRNVGRTAIDVKGGTRHAVRGCDIYEVASTGISLDGGDRQTLIPGEHTVANCDIHEFARVQKTYHPAVALNGVGNRMTHCFIHDAPHQGVGYSGNDHVIEYCEFTRIARETGDVGAIYAAMDWTYTGHVFRYNYFHDIHGPGELGCFTIYPDLPCGGIHLYGNVFYDVDQGFLTNSGRGMLIENNLFLQCARTFRFNVWGDMKMFKPGGPWEMAERLDRVKYDQPPYSTRYPMLAGLAADFAKGGQDEFQRTLPKDNIIRCNISTGPHFLGLGAQASLADVRLEKNLICNSVVMTGSPTGDGHATTYAHDDKEIQKVLGKTGNVIRFDAPGLVDPAREDFRLRRNSPARKLGFVPIPFDEIGLRLDEDRSQLPLRPPIIDSAAKSFVGEAEVRLIPCRRGTGSVVRYTLDGADPTTASPKYRRPLRLSETTTIKAAAFGQGAHAQEMSEVVSAAFTANQLGAGHGVYLGDLQEMEYVGPDGLGSVGLMKDKAPHGQPLCLAGKVYDKGLMSELVETPDGNVSRIAYALDGGLKEARRFAARMGIDDHAGSAQGKCVFSVEVRRSGTWQRVFESAGIAAGQPPQDVDVDLSKADALRLKVTGTGDGGWPRVLWADAKLL